MAFSPLSFLLGLGTAYILPVVSRSFRSIAVEATAMGMGMLDDARRLMAEQLETLEDIAAEARARREQLAAGDEIVDVDVDADEASEAADDSAEHPPETRARRRPSTRHRVNGD